MKKTLCGQEKFLSVQLFLLDRKLRCISYQAKSAPRGSHCGGTRICRLATRRRRRILRCRILFLFNRVTNCFLFIVTHMRYKI